MGQVLRAEVIEARSVDRSDVLIETQISVAHRSRAITLVNLSSHGFMGECPAGVPLRSRIKLDVPGVGPVDGYVRWSVGRRVGGRFDSPLDELQLADALAAAFA